jgi:signal peptidase I
MATINVGDLVRITDRNYNYSSYREMFRAMGFANDNIRNSQFNNGDVVRVFDVRPHPDMDYRTLYGLRALNSELEVLMNDEGIEYLLPGNWHIKVTEENERMLGNWRQACMLDTTEGYVLSEHNGQRGYWVAGEDDIPTHCQMEITTEQFIEYVLNQTPTNMPEQLTPQQQYDAALAAMNLRPGDVVRVTHRTDDNYRGWNNLWGEDAMNRCIGNEYQVDRIADNRYGVRLLGNPFNFPIYSLELVRRANDPAPTPEPTSNLENEADEAVVVTTDKVICLTDKWNYVNLNGVYEVIKRNEYYTYVKDEVGGESRYAHHYFEEWVDADLKAKRDQFRNLFGNHSKDMFKQGGDEIKKLLAELYPKLYTYNEWFKLKRNTGTNTSYTPFESMEGSYPIVLMNESTTSNENLHGCLRYDHNDVEMNTFQFRGYTYIRFRQQN